MKTLIIIVALCIAVPALAETWKDIEIRENQERQIQLLRLKQNQSRETGTANSAKDPGPCIGECGSEQGICISNCDGNGQCIGNCAAAEGRCVARCY